MTLRNLLSIFLFCGAVSSCEVGAQTPLPGPAANASAATPGAHGRQRSNLGSPEAEMMERARIRRLEEAHEEIRERADEAARLGGQLRAAFESSRTLGPEDFKKLERVEKLARKIRGAVGGSDDKVDLENPPEGIAQAVERLADLTDSLNEDVKKTSRLVVSGAVIERSNQLIELVRHLRASQRQ
jgi:hypothetical protein